MEGDAQEHNLSFERPDPDSQDYVIAWGMRKWPDSNHCKIGVAETGFFFQASFIDTIGNYQNNSLNTALGYKAMKEYRRPGPNAVEALLKDKHPSRTSKFNAAFGDPGTENLETWTKGPILALQNPGDRSVLAVGSKQDYMNFVEEVCSTFKGDLLIKLHPWNSGENRTIFEDIAKPHGCTIAKFPIDKIKGAPWVILYNSGFSIDCLLREVPVVQYAPGTFFSCPGITYSAGSAHKEPWMIDNSPTDFHSLPNFLFYKYCFHQQMPAKAFEEMVRHYATSKELFPMLLDHSYAQYQHL